MKTLSGFAFSLLLAGTAAATAQTTPATTSAVTGAATTTASQNLSISLAPNGTMTTSGGAIYDTNKIGDSTQGFMTIQNSGTTTDTLTGLACPIADATTLTGADGKPAGKIDVVPGKPVTMTPTGLHLVLQNTHFVISRGSTIPCMLTFQNSGAIQALLFSTAAPKPAN